MPKWWKSNKSKNVPKSISTVTLDTMTSSISSNEYLKKKKSRSLASIFFKKKDTSTQPISDTNLDQISRLTKKAMKDNSIFQNRLSRPPISSVDIARKRDPTLTSYRGQSIIPNQWQPTQSIQYPNLKSSAYRDTQIQLKNNQDLDENKYSPALQFLDEIINENSLCFGFSLSHITSKYCLYMSIITFLGICIIISLTAILKK
jgi:hypothetical protein